MLKMRSCWSLRLSEVIAFGFLFFFIQANAQYSPDKTVSARVTSLNNYLFPIRPGTTSILTGTMGELRNTHFHAGLDIDTPGGIGISVFAAYDGYISRAVHTTGGYGNVLYITHPDGNTTVYAHLEEFKGAVGEYIRKERYARKISEFDFEFDANQFPVTRGDIIALSGNTGGSGGPHLHFEVRNSSNEAINPLTYGFAEVKDNLAPMAFKVALKTMDTNSRINDQYGRFEFSLVRKGDTYVLPHPILASGNIGVEVLAHDKMENSRFRYGINHIDMKVNNEVMFLQTIDKINFNESRRILTVMDYKTLELKGSRFNKLYIDDGNLLSYYPGVKKKAGISVSDNDVNVEISLKDFSENVSKVKFTLKPSPLAEESSITGIQNQSIVSEVLENTLKLSVKAVVVDSSAVRVWQKGKPTDVSASYRSKTQSVFLIDLMQILPDSINTKQGTVKFNFKDRIPSNTDYTYYSDLMDLEFSQQSLYDTLYLSVGYDTLNQIEIFKIGNTTIPLHQSINVTLKPKVNYEISRNLGVYRKEGNSMIYIPAEWKNNRVLFSTRSFGEFTFARDTVPPTITPISVNSSSARLKIRDNLSGISYFEANINGEWLLMIYDYKTGYLKSEKQDKSQLLKGDFVLKVVDNAGNEKLYKQKIL
jgi:hypothetical protein